MITTVPSSKGLPNDYPSIFFLALITVPLFIMTGPNCGCYQGGNKSGTNFAQHRLVGYHAWAETTADRFGLELTMHISHSPYWWYLLYIHSVTLSMRTGLSLHFSKCTCFPHYHTLPNGL